MAHRVFRPACLWKGFICPGNFNGRRILSTQKGCRLIATPKVPWKSQFDSGFGPRFEVWCASMSHLFRKLAILLGKKEEHVQNPHAYSFNLYLRYPTRETSLLNLIVSSCVFSFKEIVISNQLATKSVAYKSGFAWLLKVSGKVLERLWQVPPSQLRRVTIIALVFQNGWMACKTKQGLGWSCQWVFSRHLQRSLLHASSYVI